jgi:ketosteroid isomerase-like protein
MVRGRGAIGEYFADGPAVTAMSFSPVSIAGEGDIAYVMATYDVTVAPEGSDPIADWGKYIEVRLRGTDNSWLIHRDMWNSDAE